MSRGLLVLAAVVALSSPPLAAQAREGGGAEAVAAGILGSYVGIRLGAEAGVRMGGGEHAWEGLFWGAAIGSVVGTALGTSLAAGDRKRGRPFERRLRDAAVGLAVGIGGAMLVGHATQDAEASLLSFSIAQGLYAGLSDGRW